MEINHRNYVTPCWSHIREIWIIAQKAEQKMILPLRIRKRFCFVDHLSSFAYMSSKSHWNYVVPVDLRLFWKTNATKLIAEFQNVSCNFFKHCFYGFGRFTFASFLTCVMGPKVFENFYYDFAEARNSLVHSCDKVLAGWDPRLLQCRSLVLLLLDQRPCIEFLFWVCQLQENLRFVHTRSIQTTYARIGST